jgi:hypothetical protein
VTQGHLIIELTLRSRLRILSLASFCLSKISKKQTISHAGTDRRENITLEKTSHGYAARTYLAVIYSECQYWCIPCPSRSRISMRGNKTTTLLFGIQEVACCLKGATLYPTIEATAFFLSVIFLSVISRLFTCSCVWTDCIPPHASLLICVKLTSFVVICSGVRVKGCSLWLVHLPWSHILAPPDRPLSRSPQPSPLCR